MRGLRSLDRSERFLFYTGLVMAASEIWKQWTLTFVLGGGSYNWWYFPFQLCSVPMYLSFASSCCPCFPPPSDLSYLFNGLFSS